MTGARRGGEDRPVPHGVDLAYQLRTTIDYAWPYFSEVNFVEERDYELAGDSATLLDSIRTTSLNDLLLPRGTELTPDINDVSGHPYITALNAVVFAGVRAMARPTYGLLRIRRDTLCLAGVVLGYSHRAYGLAPGAYIEEVIGVSTVPDSSPRAVREVCNGVQTFDTLSDSRVARPQEVRFIIDAIRTAVAFREQ